MKWSKIFWDIGLSVLFSIILSAVAMTWMPKINIFWTAILGTMSAIYLNDWIQKREERLQKGEKDIIKEG